jgi:phosphoribosyl-AMP cyclohydrolase
MWQYASLFTRGIYVIGGIYCHVNRIGCYQAYLGFQPNLGHIQQIFKWIGGAHTGGSLCGSMPADCHVAYTYIHIYDTAIYCHVGMLGCY